MGAPKGKPHRKFTPEEKLRYITELQESHISQSRFAKEQGINISILKRWMKWVKCSFGWKNWRLM